MKMNLINSVLWFLSVFNLLLISVMADEICTTPSCVNAAAKMSERMDQTIEPCDDFYNFACGTFVKGTVIPDDKGSVTTFSIINDKLQEQLRALISSPIDETEIKPFKLVKKLYQACMNTTLLEERGLQPLMDVHESLGGWPVVKDNMWNESSWTLQSGLKNLNKRGFFNNFLNSLSIGTDSENTTKNFITIDEADLALNRIYMIQGINSKIVQAYHSYQVDIAVIFGANRSRAEKEMRDCLEFEFKLANISSEESRKITVYNDSITIEELQNEYPYMQWLDYFKDIFEGTANVTADEIIAVSNVDYFHELGKLLQKTPKRTIANYLMWRMTMNSIPLLNNELGNRFFKYTSIITGIIERSPRWKECVSVAYNRFTIATSALYVRKHFQEGSKAEAMNMVDNIREEFEIILQNASWMDKETRSAGLDKIKFIVKHIGYPAELMDDQKLIDYYQDYDIDENKYLESILKLQFLNDKRILNTISESDLKFDWTDFSQSAEVSAFYDLEDNSIAIPAGILQGQFFSADRPRYMNYGAIGLVIGHEITHGFDDQGRQYDLDGNLVDWWQEDTEVAYLEKAKCIIEQYGNFTDPNVDLPLNGINTQGENIADNGGIKIAYLAYKKLVEKNGQEAKLPAINYSSSQLFWISAAQTWCSVHRPESLELIITTDAHPPGQFRILGPFSNMKEFSMDFNCPEGSPMNPKKKCEVW